MDGLSKLIADYIDKKEDIDKNNVFTDIEKICFYRAWLTAKSRSSFNAKYFMRVTHAAKYTHGGSKSSSVYLVAKNFMTSEIYLSSLSLSYPEVDLDGGANFMGIAGLLKLEADGVSLLSAIERGDYSSLQYFAENEQQLAEWVSGFKRIFEPRQPSSHILAKQVYFPVGDGKYHLISPLFPSSLAHAVHQRIVDARFSDETKAANQARKEGEWHETPITYYLNTAVMNVGGTKPQNISYLNSVRGGCVWLLPCSPPQFKPVEKKPVHLKSIFQKRSPFHFVAKDNAYQLQQYLRSKLGCDSTLEIRERRQELVNAIIEQLFSVVAGIQREEWQGWTLDKDCELKPAQQLWLDPYRCRIDDDFKFEREGGDWKKAVADDFALWLNKQLYDQALKLGMAERVKWRTQPLFKKYIREFEWSLAEKL